MDSWNHVTYIPKFVHYCYVYWAALLLIHVSKKPTCVRLSRVVSNISHILSIKKYDGRKNVAWQIFKHYFHPVRFEVFVEM